MSLDNVHVVLALDSLKKKKKGKKIIQAEKYHAIFHGVTQS